MANQAMLRLLLEAGDDPNKLHSLFGNMDEAFTALDFAAAATQEVKDLLRSFGAKTKAELVARRSPDAAGGCRLPRRQAFRNRAEPPREDGGRQRPVTHLRDLPRAERAVHHDAVHRRPGSHLHEGRALRAVHGA